MSCAGFVPHFQHLEFQKAVREYRKLNCIKCTKNGKCCCMEMEEEKIPEFLGCSALQGIAPFLWDTEASASPTAIPFSLSCTTVIFCKITNSD